MTRTRSVLAPLLILVLLPACVTSKPPRHPNDREWSAIMATYQQIDTLRRTARSVSPDAPRKEQIEALLELHKRIEPTYSPFLEKLREYYQRTGDVRAAKLYATEKIRTGDEYMNVLSRYDRAAAMYRAALALDPDNAAAAQRLAAAESQRFANFAAFSGVHPGMKEEEVRRTVGMPREDWIKHVVQNDHAYSVWIYPKEDGGASAIYFDGGVVYHTNWNAAPAPAAADASKQR